MILLLASEDYYQAARVGEQLRLLNVDSAFVDFASDNDFVLKCETEAEFSIHYGDIDLTQATLAWRSAKFLFAKFGSDQAWIDEYISGSMRSGNYRNFLSIFPGIVLNPPHVSIFANRKLAQLDLARKTGFKVPRTILTNSLAAINSWRNGKTDFIIKCLDESLIPVLDGNIKQQAITTSRLDMDYLAENSNGHEPFHIFVQENVPKKWEHRTVYVDNQIFNFRINPYQHPLMETDYRHGGLMVDYVPTTLPEEIAQKIRTFAKAADLFSGCFDFIEAKNGDFVFLEVNPEGVWGKHDDILEGKISRMFAKSLVAKYFEIENSKTQK